MVGASSADAAPPHLISLPSPLTPLSASPPLGGGAVGPREGRQHRVNATQRVTVLLDRTGMPFTLRVVQRLDVLRVGDYTYAISAPVIRVERAPGSQSDPGQRAHAILWAGFSPGRRILAAAADLRLEAATALPLRLEARDGRLTLRNVTGVTTTGFDAAARPTELLATFAAFRRAASSHAAPVVGGTALVTSPVTPVKLDVSAPLAIAGTIGGRAISVVLGGAAHPSAATFPDGAVRLVVRPLQAPELLSPPPGESGRALLARAVRASLELARVKQYDTFLGNPDPDGSSRTTYVYVTARRPHPSPVATAAPGGSDWLRTVLWIGGAVVALGIGAVVWARS
jgi:hypothetical protein